MNIGDASILITGTHYSGTTVVGEILRRQLKAPLLYEPFSPEPRVLCPSSRFKTWYHDLSAIDIQEAEAVIYRVVEDPYSFEDLKGASLVSLGWIRALKRLNWSFRKEKRFLIKDPLAAMSAALVQYVLNIFVIVTFRRPESFTSSMIIRREHIDLDAEPYWQAEIEGLRQKYPEEDFDFANQTIDQAILIYNTVYRRLLASVDRKRAYFLNLTSMPPVPNPTLTALNSELKLSGQLEQSLLWTSSRDVRSILGRKRRRHTELSTATKWKISKCCFETYSLLLNASEAPPAAED